MRTGVVGLLVLLEVSPAFGQDTKLEEAKRDFEAGATAFAVGQFAVAAELFARSYDHAPRPGTLFSLAQAERRQYYVDRDPEHLRRAIDALRRYVGGVDQGGRRTEAVDVLTELEPLYERVSRTLPAPSARQVTRLMVSSRPGSVVLVDGKLRSETPFIRDIEPGRHRVQVEVAGCFPESREVEVKEGAFVVLDVTLRERPATLRIGAPGGAEVFVDGVSHGRAPLANSIALPAGDHTVSVVRSGSLAWQKNLRVDAGGDIPIVVELRTSPQRTASWATLGAGGAVLVTAGVFVGIGLVYQGQARDFLGMQSSGPVSSWDIQDYHRAQHARDDWRTAAQYTAIGGAALLGLGGALYFLDRPSPPSSATGSARATVEAISGGGILGLSGTF
ncbi:MAG: PEGA domain-containing protein [Myxococcales bacterium]